MRIDRVPYPDIAEYLRTKDVMIVPLGAQECYGPHLATGTELHLCERFATELGERTGFAVAPILPFNYSPMFLDYPGTCSAEMSTIEAYVGQVCDGLARQGFRRFLFVNIHAGSLGPLESVCRSLRARHGAVGAVLDVLSVMRDVGGVTWTSTMAPTGHGGEMVTSVALHVAADLVFMDRAHAPARLRDFAEGMRTMTSGRVAIGNSSLLLYSNMSDYSPSGIQGDPTSATAEKGRIVWENALAFAVEAALRFARVSLLGG